jgi:cysteine desulfuration protein SufE
MSDVLARSRALVETMSLLPDATEQLTWLVGKARKAAPLPPELRRDTFRIEGCISELWLVGEAREARLWYRADAAASIPKGVAVALCEVFSGGTPEEILAVGDGFIREAGIPQVLSSNRSNGLAHLVKRILGAAEAARGAAA